MYGVLCLSAHMTCMPETSKKKKEIGKGSNPHPVDFRSKFQIPSTLHLTIKIMFFEPKKASSPGRLIERTVQDKKLQYSKLQAMREPWSTEECPGEIKVCYKMLMMDEK